MTGMKPTSAEESASLIGQLVHEYRALSVCAVKADIITVTRDDDGSLIFKIAADKYPHQHISVGHQLTFDQIEAVFRFAAAQPNQFTKYVRNLGMRPFTVSPKSASGIITWITDQAAWLKTPRGENRVPRTKLAAWLTKKEL